MHPTLVPWRRLGLLILLGWIAGIVAAEEPERFGLGRTPTPEEINRWDIDISPDGAGLPPGRGTVTRGQEIYAQKCQACHGVDGAGTPNDRLVHPYRPGVIFARERGIPRTIGSYWPYATTIFDYIQRAMPFDKPGSLTPAEVYSVTAWLLFMNGVIAEETVVDAMSLPEVSMPALEMFYWSGEVTGR